MKKVKQQICYNCSARTETIRYIVIHDTGNPGIGADAKAHFQYFNGGNRGSSADVFVDAASAWYVNDYIKYASWHCGDGKGKYGVTNQNSVGVEICINQDSDYDTAFANMVQVVRELMQELNIPAERVVRHFDASGKCCPKSMSANNWRIWTEFQQMLKGELSMNQYEELKQEIRDLTETVKQLAVEVGSLRNPMIYNYIDNNMPEWAREAVIWATKNGYVKGDGTGLALTEEKLWQLTVMYRMAKS